MKVNRGGYEHKLVIRRSTHREWIVVNNETVIRGDTRDTTERAYSYEHNHQPLAANQH